MRFSKEELYAMPILQLRGIDIQEKEEEVLVQEVLNARLAEMPVENPVHFTSMQTDNLTPEKEAELQAEINARNAGIKAQFEPTEPGPLPDPTIVDPMDPVSPEQQSAPIPEEVKEPLVQEEDEVVSLEKLDTKNFAATTATAKTPASK